MHIMVIAKEPAPGLSKTRLSPPCSPLQAAAVARAALEDTLDAVARAPATGRVVVLEGAAGDWLPRGFDVVPQRGTTLAERLSAAFEDCPAPALVIGMDTPQITPSHLEQASDLLTSPGVDAVLGPADDGGYWTIGLKTRVEGALEGVPMSTERTAQAQLRRLEELGLAWKLLPSLRDLDYWDDALKLARSIPYSRLARAVARVERDLARVFT